jgi:hypothetical protein
MPKRQYPFAVPVRLSGVQTVGAKAQYGHLIARLPPRLQQKVNDAGLFSPLVITKADLDSLPDPLYRELAQAAGLEV